MSKQHFECYKSNDIVECCFDNVERCFNIAAFRNNVEGDFRKFRFFGNNVEATFDFVERIVRLVAFDNVASTLLLVWTRLKAILLCYHVAENVAASGNRAYENVSKSRNVGGLCQVCRHYSDVPLSSTWHPDMLRSINADKVGLRREKDTIQSLSSYVGPSMPGVLGTVTFLPL